MCNFLDNSGIAFVLARHIFTDNKMKSYIHALLLHGEKNINVIENNKTATLLSTAPQ